MEADSEPFWIGAAGPPGGKADAAFGLRFLLSKHQPQKDTSTEGLFDREVLLIPYESIQRSMCPSEKAFAVRASVEGSESFALGQRFAVATLTASLSPRAKIRLRLLITSGRLFRHPRSKKEGYVWFRRRSLLLHGISGSRLRPILDRSGGSAGAGRLMLLLVYDCFCASISPRRIHPKRDYLIAESC